MKIIGTGLSGLVGSRVLELLSDTFDFESLSLEANVDIRDKKKVFSRIFQSDGEVVLHLAAMTDVDACEREKHLATKSQAWQVNVEGTANIVEACRSSGKRLIYISTDFVFPDREDPYSESDSPNPINFYGKTKYEGEKIVASLNRKNYLIGRISFPYRVRFEPKLDVVRAILAKLVRGEIVEAVEDQIIVPTFVDDIAQCLRMLINQRQSGIFHIVGSQAISPFDLALHIAQIFHLDTNLVKPTLLKKYYSNGAKRPYKSVLKNDKIIALGARLLPVDKGLAILYQNLI